MRVVKIAVMVIACVAQTACVTQRETLPPETRAELLRLGRIIKDETHGREERIECLRQYCKVVSTVVEAYGPNAVNRRTIVESLGLTDDSGGITDVYSISNGDGSYYMLFITYDLRDATFVQNVIINAEARM